MSNESIHERFAEVVLAEAMTDTPAILIHGPRQCGKTTMARVAGARRGYTYFTFDDAMTLAAAQADPSAFVQGLPRYNILDEVQRAPDIFIALKAVIDRERLPGRFLLTGSANILLLPKLSDSLAGRMEIVRLHPMAQCEVAGTPSQFLHALFDDGLSGRMYQRLGDELVQRIVAGGFPAALARTSHRRRLTWYRDYIETQVQRDVRELARIGSLDAMPRLLALAAGQTARLINISDLASPFRLSRPTIHDYVMLLERIFLVDRLAPWHSNRLSRLIKTPKLHICDTGVACALLGYDAKALTQDRELLGQLLETFVFQELRRLASWHPIDLTFSHFRDKDGLEVDVVIERGAREVAGIEIKASSTVTARDFRGLRKLKAATGARFRAGVVFYDGEASVSFGEKMYAVPVQALWAMTKPRRSAGS